MKRYAFSLAAVVLIGALTLLALEPDRSTEAAGPQVASAFGRASVGGEEVLVHVTVVVPAGADVAAATRGELARQSA